MDHKLYTHEEASLLPRLARRGFPSGSFLSTDLDWTVEDAIQEGAEERSPHVVFELTVPEEVLGVPDEDIEEALHGTVEDDWEEVTEGEGQWAEEAEEEEEGVEEVELEEPDIEASDDPDWPKNLSAAMEITESATLTKRLSPDAAIVLGVPWEIFAEEQTPEESAAGLWFRFDIPPTALPAFRKPFLRELLRKMFLPTGRA